MPEPLVCEDISLTRLLETVHKTPGARILYQDTVRRGGVLGFFAREVHRVAYLAEEQLAEPVADSTAPDGIPGALEQSPFADLLASAEAAEDRLRQPVDQPVEPAAADFASLLRRYVDQSETADTEPPDTEPQDIEPQTAGTASQAEAAEPAVAEATRPVSLAYRSDDADEPLAGVTSLGLRGRDARGRMELLLQLRQVGVPVSLNPGAGVQNPYEALQDVLEQLPAPAELPTRAGQLIVLVGEGAAAIRAARTVSRMLRLRLGSIVAAGTDSVVGGPIRRISSPAEAALLREELAAANTPSVLAIATDGAGTDAEDPWPAAMLAALRPAVVWAVVDARWKSEDSQAQLGRLPRVDGLVVHSAELSASPASVWELDLPIGLLDDRRPSGFIWLGMLVRLLGGSPRHRATA
jgi:uncharacterized protein (DUF2237 family)